MPEREPLFDLRHHLPFLEGDGWRRGVREGLEGVLGLRRVRAIEEELLARSVAGVPAFQALRELIGFELSAEGVCGAIPPEGPLVVAANHPFGGADAVALPELCLRVRDDVQVLANREALGFRALEPYLLPVEILGGRRSRLANVGALREAWRHLRSGGVLVVFPAGAVSYWQDGSARVEDPPWPEHVPRLVARSGAPVLPVRFEGRNPAWWQLLARIHPSLRTGLLPRAFLGMRGATVRCRAGEVLEPGGRPSDPGDLARALRRALEQMG